VGADSESEAEAAGEVPALVREPEGARGRWFITPHAVRRYIERCPGAGCLSYERALERLIDESERAHFVKDRRNPEEQLWRCGKPWRLRFVVADRGHGKPVLVTVLRGCDAPR
jgi:hypothetical protein